MRSLKITVNSRGENYKPFCFPYNLSAFIPGGGGGYSLIWAIWGRAAGQGMVFGLAVLNRVYNLTCLCPKQVKNLS